jgi:hypothetical protein
MYQEEWAPASVTSYQVCSQPQCFHYCRCPLPDAEIAALVQKAKVSKLQLACEAEDILYKVDRIMGEMRTNPVIVTVEESLENNCKRLSKLEDDVKACSKQYCGWLDKYEDEMDYPLYFQVYHKFSKMEDDYDVYNKEMLEKHRLIKNKNQNVPEMKPEGSNSEDDDLAEGQASLEAAKDRPPGLCFFCFPSSLSSMSRTWICLAML